MRRLLSLAIITLLTISLSTCSDTGTGTDPDNGDDSNGDQTTTYTVTVDANEGGSVTPSGENTYDEGEEIELQADPSDEYAFTHWSGDIDSTSDNPHSLTVDQDYSITANFELKSYELTINTEGEGAVNEQVLEQKSKDYEHGTVVELTANPAEGWKFVEWKGDIEGTDNPAEITVDDPKEVTAVFEKKMYALTVNTNGEGAVSEEVVQQKSTDYEYGTVVELTANPAEGWTFVDWEGANTSSDNPIQVTVDSPKEVTANFEKKSFTVTTQVEGEGTVSKSPNQETYEYESTVELTAEPAEGYEFKEWKDGISSTDNPTELTVVSDTSVTAVFEKKSYDLSVTTEGEGSVAEEVVQTKSTSYEHGTTVELTANPAEGWQFVEWKGDLTGTDNPDQITVDEPKEVTAIFEKKSFTLTTSVNGDGSLSRDPDQSEYEYGTTVDLSASAETGWKFTEWSGDASGSEHPLSITIDSNKDITATFEKKTYALTVNTDGEGSISKDPDQSEYEYNTTVDLTAEPAEGWKFVTWEGASTSTDAQIQLTMDEAKELTAVFEKKVYTLTTNTTGEGSVTKDPDQSEYQYNTTVTLTANADEGWKFVEWQGDLSSTNSSEEITIDSNKEVTAVFEKQTYTLSIEITGEGSVTKSPDQTEYEYGTEVELTASATGDWVFNKWEGDVTGNNKPVTVTINANKSITAIFKNTLFAGGVGTENNPYQISTIDQLQAINQYPNANYIQINDIDASETINWNSGKGFQPIGDQLVKFKGSFDGQEFHISELFINREQQDDIGLFGFIQRDGIVRNIIIVKSEISGNNNTGGLVGTNNGKTKNSLFDGKISGSDQTGGLIGQNMTYGAVINSSSSGQVNADGRSIGGLIGMNDKYSCQPSCEQKVEQSWSSSKVTGGSTIGGLVGYNNYGNIIESNASGNVSTSSRTAGGLIGINFGSILKSYATGDVTGQTGSGSGGGVGGLIGTQSSGTTENSYSVGKVVGEENVGGLIGSIIGNNSILKQSYTKGDVDGNTHVGGLIGLLKDGNSVIESFAIGSVSGTTDVGGLIGVNGGSPNKSYWDTESTNQSNAVGRGSSDGTTGLTTSEMTGTSAESNMPDFDWTDIWVTTDSYPALSWE